MSKRSLRVVVAGGGRVGARTAELIDGRGHDVVVVERDPERCESLSDAYVATVIEGDATEPGVLRQAGLDRADAVIALTASEGANLSICLLADRLGDGLRTVMRATEGEHEEYREFVDEVVYPERAGARLAANAIEGDVRALVDVSGDVEVLEITVAEDAPVAGRSPADVALPRGSVVVTDVHANEIATAETVLEPGRTYTVAVEPPVEDEIVNLFRG
ncbi:MAG: TrkA family potassium uptake protein [Haloferacaceae archaeon]